MRKLLLINLLVLFSSIGFSQPFGNEWINYSQQYYYFKVAQTGIYRLDYNTLLNAGIPVGTINPQNIQIFGKQKEQFIHIEGEQDGIFDPTDYIEFYAEYNNGWLDTLMYGGIANMTDDHYSLFNDTLRYYITWNNSTNNRRLVDETDVNFTAFTPIDFVWKESYTKNTNYYLQGENFDGSSSSLLTAGEGWFNPIFNGAVAGGAVFNSGINTQDPYTGPGAPDAWCIATSASASNSGYTGQGNHHLQINYGTSNIVVYDSVFTGFRLIKDTFNIPVTSLTQPSTQIQHKIIHDQGALTDFQAVGSVTIHYPHTTNFNATSVFEFSVPFNSTETKSRLDITGYTGVNPILYIINDTVRRVTVSGVVNNYQTLIPNLPSAADAKCYLIPASTISNITTLYPANGTGFFTNYAANSIDSAYIILTHESLLAEANQYASYRSSLPGGGYNTIVVDVEQLYDQYGGGIQKHSMALRRFCADMINSWNTVPSYLLLLGKGIREATESSNGTFHGTRKMDTTFHNSLVPSYGYPSSDILISAQIIDSTITPAIPTGRVAAKDGAEVLLYLQKVMEYEAAQQNPNYSIADKAWMKHILHFGGGANANEQTVFANYLNYFASTAEDTLFGGYVDTYLKETSTPINPVDFSEISDFLQEGVSLMTFFGHASSAGFDQNIDEVVNWNNQGKYPFLLGNGCYAGDIYQPTSISNSEEFVLIPQLGTIGFLSTSKSGFSGPLFLFSDEFYKQFSYLNYGGTASQHVQSTIDYIYNNYPGFYNYNVAMQMTLHGDPAIKINYHEAPEFEVRIQDVIFDPPFVSLGTDSLDVKLAVTNIGRSSPDSIQVEMIRHFPNNNGDSIAVKFISGIPFRDTVVFRIPVLHNLATGINLFDFTVDIPSNVTEVYDEIGNNQTSSTLFINSNGIGTIYPYDFAIVPDTSLTFKASTFNPLSVARDYIFEIDTTDLFNSPLKRNAIVNAPGGVVELPTSDWKNATSGLPDPLYFTDSTVYFWRVSPDSIVKIWDESSFQYIEGQTGWGQAHFFQFKDNIHQSITYNRPQRSWTWDEQYRFINCDLYPFATNPIEWNNTLWSLDGALQEYNGCGNPQFVPSINVAVIDPITLEAWTTADHYWGNTNQMGVCRSRAEKYFVFHQNHSGFPYSMDSLIGFYNNYIPTGHYVLFYTFNFASYADWTPQLFSFFQSIGADSIYTGRPNEAFIYLVQKGNEVDYNNYVSSTVSGTLLNLNDTLFSLGYQGNMIAEVAGPAARWDALYWQQEAKESPTYDSTQIFLVGIKLDGTEDTLINTPFTSLDSIINLNTIVDANVYPYVRLSGYYFDDQLFTPAQTNRWQLLYQPMPEAAVNPPLGFYFNVLNDSLYEGQNLEIAVAIENISPYDMDSLLVHYWVEDNNRQLNYISYPRQDSLRSGEVLYDTLTFSTQGFPGLNSIWMEVNPIPIGSAIPVYDQLEQHHFNNYLQIPFYVNADLINPILDVTFDGIHILNGDIVSGNPMILITLKDENPYLIMNEDSDTSHFAVYLTDPNGSQSRIYFNQGATPMMTFTPSTGPQDKFKIEFNPSLLIDGKYELLVQASDKSGNESGSFDYRIQFEVINHSTITEVMNYPNPFSTKTHFVFTLTGNVLPDFMKIQIMTVSGKVVREIMMDELGTIRIGRNITDYAWDGRDEFGDQLANGIYLYRVVAKINGENIEKRESGADEYFNKGFGKMYLMR